MSHGKVGITLEDVSIHLNLPVDGDVVAGSTCLDLGDFYEQLLGRWPDARSMTSGHVRMSWLQRNFG